MYRPVQRTVNNKQPRQIRGISDIFHFPLVLINNIVNTHQFLGQGCRLSAM